MATMGRKSIWELALEDDHLMRLGDVLAAQIGKEAVVRLELELDQEWSGGGQEAIRRRLDEVFLSDQENQWSPLWSHWRCHWQEKPEIVKIVDPNHNAIPFVLMWTSKGQSHASCPLYRYAREAGNVKCSKEGLRAGVHGQMEDK